MSRSREILFEFQVFNGSVKATAIDPETGLEVTVIGPAKALQTDLERIAARKLQRALSRAKRSSVQGPDRRDATRRAQEEDAGDLAPGAASDGRGLIV